MSRGRRPALSIAGVATTCTRLGKGGGEGADASGPAHPCASDGWPGLGGASRPSSLPPHRTTRCRPTSAATAAPREATNTPTHRQEETPKTAANGEGSSPRSATALPAVVQPSKPLDTGQPAHQPATAALHHHLLWPWQGQRPEAASTGPRYGLDVADPGDQGASATTRAAQRTIAASRPAPSATPRP